MIVPGRDGRRGMANGQHMVGVTSCWHRLLHRLAADAEVEAAAGAVTGHPAAGLDTIAGHTLAQLHPLLQIIAGDASHAPRLLLVPAQPLVDTGVLGVNLLKYNNLAYCPSSFQHKYHSSFDVHSTLVKVKNL